MKTIERGAQQEQSAAVFLKSQGLELVANNYHSRMVVLRKALPRPSKRRLRSPHLPFCSNTNSPNHFAGSM